MTFEHLRDDHTRIVKGQRKGDQTLILTGYERLDPKDFSHEVRARLDVELFVNRAELLLDEDENVSIRELIEAMLSKALGDTPADAISEIARQIFLPGFPDQLAQTIQSASLQSSTSLDGLVARRELHFDSTWIVAIASLTQITKRQIVVAKFKRPFKACDGAESVRLFLLVVTPLEDKLTKSSIETARTFATMLMDSEFKTRLLEAKSELEFKSLMMVKAQLLSQAGDTFNKSPNKYMLDAAPHLGLYLSKEEKGAAPMMRAGTCLVELSSLDQAGSRLFGKNPRTSKLFELISTDESGSPQENGFNHLNNNCPNDTKEEKPSECCGCLGPVEFGTGIWGDIKRRSKYYMSDFTDGFVGPAGTFQKTVATTWFLYFGILLPTIAFSSLNTNQTHGHMGDLQKALIGQALGGLGFALFAGQPMVIIMTTAPLCLYTKVIYQICIDYHFDFLPMYAAVGLWNAFFLIMYSLFGFSKIMKWCTRSTEEVFALFIVVAFITDATKDTIKNFKDFYSQKECSPLRQYDTVILNGTRHEPESFCKKETSLLFIMLMLGTLWLGTILYRFRKTPYLTNGLRNLVADYALPAAVVIMSFVGSGFFNDVYAEKPAPMKDLNFTLAHFETLPATGIIASMFLGFTLSVLFFMDQNISAAMVMAPQNNLKKGSAYHFDLLVVALLNVVLTMFGLPMMHGVLPHSPLHVRCMADIREQVDNGHKHEVITNARETRITGIASHLLLLASLYLIPFPIMSIPSAVLNGLFLYMAYTSLDGLQMFDRIMLIFTQQSNYPPDEVVRKVPQRKIHLFTFMQLVQLLVMCLFGFSPFSIVEMFFPVIILLMIPFRHRIIPKFINTQYLNVLDGWKH